MGPAPSARSGHSMAAVGTRVYILGGASTEKEEEDHTVFHILETSEC